MTGWGGGFVRWWWFGGCVGLLGVLAGVCGAGAGWCGCRWGIPGHHPSVKGVGLLVCRVAVLGGLCVVAFGGRGREASRHNYIIMIGREIYETC